MAILAIKVPEDVSSVLSSIKVPGMKVPQDEKHITLLYLGDNLSIDTLGEIIIETARVTEHVSPFQVKLNGLTSFPKGNDGYPIICPIEIGELFMFHDRLVNVFDKRGIEYDKKFPDFKPHVTLSYSEERPKDRLFKEISWVCEDVMLWGGDEGEHRMATRFEFLG